ncbi:MAG: class D sortase [Armatimonadota bacterium]
MVLLLLGIGLLLFPSVARMLGTHEQRKLEHQWQDAHRYAKTPEPASPPPKQRSFPVVKVVIPAIRLDAVVVEGVTESALSKGPGHFPDTALPGEIGNCCIAGHRNMYGWWFWKLNKLSAGDKIVLRTTDNAFTYYVTQIRKVKPTDIGVLDQTSDRRLTLITCTPVPHPTHRLVVIAEMAKNTSTH